MLVTYFYFLDTLKEIWNRIIYQRWNGDIDACSAEVVQVEILPCSYQLLVDNVNGGNNDSIKFFFSILVYYDFDE